MPARQTHRIAPGIEIAMKHIQTQGENKIVNPGANMKVVRKMQTSLTNMAKSKLTETELSIIRQAAREASTESLMSLLSAAAQAAKTMAQQGNGELCQECEKSKKSSFFLYEYIQSIMNILYAPQHAPPDAPQDLARASAETAPPQTPPNSLQTYEDKEEENKNFSRLIEIINNRSSRAGARRLRETAEARRMVRSLLKAGFTWQDMFLVANHYGDTWPKDPKMAQFYVPTSLFRPTLFQGKLERATAPAPPIPSAYGFSRKPEDNRAMQAAIAMLMEKLPGQDEQQKIKAAQSIAPQTAFALEYYFSTEMDYSGMAELVRGMKASDPEAKNRLYRSLDFLISPLASLHGNPSVSREAAQRLIDNAIKLAMNSQIG